MYAMIGRLLFFIVTLGSLAAVGCSSCQQSDFRQLASPDGRYVLLEKEVNCSALDPYGVRLTIRAQQPRLGATWLGFPQKEVFAADVALGMTQIKWIDNHNVEVSCTGCEKYGLATRVEEWKDVKIHFNVGNAKKGAF